jgi:hypothetical protein
VWWSLVKVTVQFPDDFLVENVPSGMEWFYDLIRTSYSIAVIILMLNLLIAMMTNTYKKYFKNSEYILLMQKYNIMAAMLNKGTGGPLLPAVEKRVALYAIRETAERTIDKKGNVGKKDPGEETVQYTNWHFNFEIYNDNVYTLPSLYVHCFICLFLVV